MSVPQQVDWDAAANSPEFKELVAEKRRFVLPATIFFLTWYFGFIILAGVAPDFMGEKLVKGVTVGYVFAFSQFIMVWVLAAMYLRRAKTVFDPLAEKAAAKALEGGRTTTPPAQPPQPDQSTRPSSGNGEATS